MSISKTKGQTVLKKELKGVPSNTLDKLEIIAGYSEMQEYFLVGGTGLSIRVNHRLSEDLDFFAYNKFPGRKRDLPKIATILKNINRDFPNVEIIDSTGKTYLKLLVDGVKVDFLSENRFHSPKEFDWIGNIRLPVKETLLGMKLVAIELREEWRDVYDVGVLAKDYSIPEMYKHYSKVMSRYYCGSEEGRKNLFINAIKDLSNVEVIQELYEDDDMLHLLGEKDKISPEYVSKMMSEKMVDFEREKLVPIKQKKLKGL
ncbi:MAG: nucleotidyl transferase AbiEii/AbiGii toxin family protein [Reichenbachiella sp.]|uniref:nucleotidyl transferase AbiEii/AbiGii toxin family protein n=1 Tax=Reichenbachiella sp. TaxID=2184521 RepID=UPI003262F91E